MSVDTQMTVDAAGGKPTADPGSTVVSLEWIRRRLEEVDHPGHDIVAQVLAAIPMAAHATSVLKHPWTAQWIDTAIRLIDRNALRLLPDGHVAAHIKQGTNLVAALLFGRTTVRVRLDADGEAWLPGTGLIIAGRSDQGGLEATLVPVERNQTSLTLEGERESPAARVEGVAASIVPETRSAERRWSESIPAPWSHGNDEGASCDASETERVDSATDPSDVVANLVGQWSGATLATVDQPAVEPTVVDSTALTTLLAAYGVPMPEGPNLSNGGRLRLDNSFDHLCLLSVRHPDRFSLVASTAVGCTNPQSRRIRGHVAYIEQRFIEAATIYAGLLAEHPDDLDLWRDACWALRHAGWEEITRAWVLHPSEVAGVASAVAWMGDGHEPTAVGGNEDRVLRSLIKFLGMDNTCFQCSVNSLFRICGR